MITVYSATLLATHKVVFPHSTGLTTAGHIGLVRGQATQRRGDGSAGQPAQC